MKTAKMKPGRRAGKKRAKGGTSEKRTPYGEGLSENELNRFEEEETRQSGTAGVS